MEAYLFIYSRLERFDYRLIYAPSQSFLPNPTRSYFVSFAREVINTDTVSNGNINANRWSLVRRGSKVLFGVGCYNQELGDCSSEIENRKVRGFFGMVFDYDEEYLPKDLFTLEYFQGLYSSYMEPIWHAQKKDEFKVNSLVVIINIPAKEEHPNFIELNTDRTRCKVLPESISQSDAINSALKMTDVEVVLGLNDIKHVTRAVLSQPRNVSLIGNNTEMYFPILQKKSENKPSKSNVGANKQSVQGKSRSAEKKVKLESSDYEYLAESIYSKLKRCGANVRLVVKHIAEKCDLIVTDGSNPRPFIKHQENNDEVNTNSCAENEIMNSQDTMLDEETINRKKTERQLRLAEIRKQYSEKEHHGKIPRVPSADLRYDMENIEELQGLTAKNKKISKIEDL